MQCRIDDEYVNNPWEALDDAEEERTLETITAYGLMGEEFDIWMKKDNSGYEIHLEDEKGKDIITKNVHPYVIENMVRFCTRFILQYNQIRKFNNDSSYK